jgi:alkylation response protein AidB-like acyl-CoA dehydrogenase
MNFDLSVKEKLLKDSVREFFSKEIDGTYLREMAEYEKGYNHQGIWGKMAELGWMGLLIPKQYGGFEMTFFHMAVLLFEMGYACFPGPFFTSSVVGVLTVLEGGNPDQKQRILPEVAKGERILTLAWTETNGTYNAKGINTRAEMNRGDYVISGTKMFVPYANVAEMIICAAKSTERQENEEESITLFITETRSPGVKIEMLQTLAGDKQCVVTFDGVRVSKDNLLGGYNQGWTILKKVLQKSSVMKCAEMSRGAQRVLEMVVEYAKKRIQFNRPIGSFQAVQHHCANMLTYVDTSTLMTYQTAWRISEGRPYEKEASMSKAWVSDAYRKLVRLGHQVMGGMGYMEEMDLQLYFKQAKTAELAFGDAYFHREILAQQIGL